MSYIDQNLRPGETIVLKGNVHGLYIFALSVKLAAALLLFAFVLGVGQVLLAAII